MAATNAQDVRYDCMYTIAEAAGLTRVNVSTLRTWSLGRAHPYKAHAAYRSVIIPADPKRPDKLSFINVVETHVLAGLRKVHRVPLGRIRKAISWLRNETGMQHPLAELDIETDGRDVFARFIERLVSASEGGQVVFPEVVGVYLQRMDRDAHKIPTRFYPFTYSTPSSNSPRDVVVDPAVAFGRPIIKGTRIPTSAILERFNAGESQAVIADDYQLAPNLIEEAVRYESSRRAA